MSSGGVRAAVADDTGTPVELPARAERVVSLVPSLTESIAHTCPEVLVAATQWCTHPADLSVEPSLLRVAASAAAR